MHGKTTWKFLAVLITLGFLFSSGLWWYTAQVKNKVFSDQPVSGIESKWRIAYYQGGDYINYSANLRALVDGLAELGWMDPLDIPAFDDPEDVAPIWQFISAYGSSDYIEFVADAFWSAEWDDTTRLTIREEAIDYLTNQGNIDLVLAMGTWAGQDLANDSHSVTTIVLSASDPVEAGIIHSADDSGYDHVFAGIDPDRFRRQVRLFSDIIGFKQLGVVYENSPDGRVYANVSDLEQVARERGFTLVHCHARDDGADIDLSIIELERCYSQLAPQIDALWIGLHLGEQPKFMPGILTPMFEHHIPTWAQIGPMAVQRGALLSIQSTHFNASGRWYAGVMGRILNGARPRELSQIFNTPGLVAINLETARRIEFEPPQGVLNIADEIYESIEGE